MDMPYRSHSYWLKQAFLDIDGVVDRARETLKDVDYDTMVGTGLSGSLVIPVLSREFRKYFAIVRKGEYTHSDLNVEGQIGHKWIFVDDFISSGATRNKVKEDVTLVTGNESEYVGYYVYHSDRFEAEVTYKAPEPRGITIPDIEDYLVEPCDCDYCMPDKVY